MNDLQAAGTAAVALKSVADLAKSLADAMGSGKLREQAFKLYGEILSAQASALAANAAQAALVDEKGALEAKLAEYETWDREKARYEFTEIGPGVFAYALKLDAIPSEPMHLICPGCYQHRRKSILQSNGISHTFGTEALTCKPCGLKLEVYHPERGTRSRASAPTSWKTV